MRSGGHFVLSTEDFPVSVTSHVMPWTQTHSGVGRSHPMRHNLMSPQDHSETRRAPAQCLTHAPQGVLAAIYHSSKNWKWPPILSATQLLC